MKHTPEPWSYRGDIVYFPSLGGGFSLSNCPMPETNAKRIVACVNACAGMDDPQTVISRLRGAVIDAACKYQDIEQQRDELLAAMKKLAQHKCANYYMKGAILEAIAKAGEA